MIGLVIPLGALAFLGVYLLLLEIRSGDSAHIDVTPLTLGFAAAAGLATTAGTIALGALRAWSVGALFAVAAALLAFSFLAMFSIGLAVLPVGLGVLVIAIGRLRREERGPMRAAASGVVIGLGLVAYLLVVNQPATAACRAGGGVTSSGGLFGANAGSGGGYATADGIQLGYIDEGERIAYFSCEGWIVSPTQGAIEVR